MVNETPDQRSRDRALAQLKKRRDFHGHLLVYLLVNGFLVTIWAITGVHGFFWPVFVIAAWGIGLVMNAWDVYWRPEITEQDIQREMEREHTRS
jgi:2TM domain-containing protein